MTLRPFEIHQPSTVSEASRLLSRYGDEATVYGGGTELIPVMKGGLAEFRHLVDIKTIPGLETIASEGGVLRIGAAATHRAIARSATVRASAPALAEVAAQVGNLRVRAMGTLGGNLCFAEPHSDPAAVLAALGATLVLASNGTERRVDVDAFFLGALRTDRRPDEIMARVEVPAGPPRAGWAYQRFATHERPTAGVAAMLALDGRVIAGARIAVGGVGGRPERVPDAEAALIGHAPEARSLRAAGERTGRAVEVVEDLYGSVEYKRHIVAVLATRALRQAADQARAAAAGAAGAG
jgi:carbon-monoxide dehydrogenase medium subunit